MIIYSHSILLGIITSCALTFAAEGLKEDEILKNLECPPPPTQCTNAEQNEDYEFSKEFHVNGKNLYISSYEEENLFISCTSNEIAIDDPSFPHSETTIFISKLTIKDCKPPKNTYVDAIKKLNITFESLGLSYSRFDYQLNLESKHFEGLDLLKEFSFEADYFLRQYFDLELLKSLPPKISLVLRALVLPPFPAWNKFENVIIELGSPWRTYQTWGNCDHLRNLTVKELKVNILPEGWLANCTQLEELRIENLLDLRELPNRMLENSISLRSLTIKNCKIQIIPNDFLSYSNNLRFLDMSHNEINPEVDDSYFTSLTHLETIDFTGNGIDPLRLGILKSLTSLKYLNLDENSWAGLCQDYILKQTGELAIWPHLPSVVNLSLSSTTVTKPCPEWQEAMPSLKYLNLSMSMEEEPLNLTFSDLKLIRESGWEIDARNNTINIIYNETDYMTVLKEVNDKNIQNEAVMLLSYPVECNCKWYWFILALKKKPNHISMPGFSCMQHWGNHSSKYLAEILPEDIMCALEKNCPIHCECFQLAKTGTVLVNCTNTELKKIPDINNLKELVVPNNHLSILRSEDLPDSLEYIDLRNNLIAVVTPDVAKTLFSVPTRKIKLSGNPILCQCENKEFMELLHINKGQVLDFNTVTCIDDFLNTPINSVDPQTLCSSKMLNITLILLVCIVLLIILASGIYYLNRRKINSFLAKYGFKFDDEDLDIHKIYDAFISFSYEDTWFVTDELMPVLEEQHNFKLCVHTRDWMVGDWIPAQIARSVQDSRRTVIVLSKNFLSSIWALLEFRTAHIQALRDKRIRVIIILLEDLTSKVGMDEEMEMYLTTNTYVKWGEPNFWEKLSKALEYRNNEKQIMEAGEKVAKLYRSI